MNVFCDRVSYKGPTYPRPKHHKSPTPPSILFLVQDTSRVFRNNLKTRIHHVLRTLKLFQWLAQVRVDMQDTFNFTRRGGGGFAAWNFILNDSLVYTFETEAFLFQLSVAGQTGHRLISIIIESYCCYLGQSDRSRCPICFPDAT